MQSTRSRTLWLMAFAVTLVPDLLNGREPVVGGPCEGCELVYVGIPSTIHPVSRIAPVGEPGTPLRIEGTVLDRSGRPVPGIIVYAYQTNLSGRYPTDKATTQRHGRLRGWARSDAEGRYVFETIRPGAYPSSNEPEHIHMHVIEPGRCTYYIDDILFEDDRRLTDAHISRMSHGRGGPGITKPTRNEAGVLVVRRDIILGQNIPDYPR